MSAILDVLINITHLSITRLKVPTASKQQSVS